MRLRVDARAEVRFAQPQRRIIQLLRLTPPSFAGQNIVDWRIDVGCDARLRPGRDGFGNETTMLYIDGPTEGFALTVEGEVLTDDRAGMIAGTPEPLPSALFLRATPATEADPAMLALAEEVAELDRSPLGRVHALRTILHERIAFRRDAPPDRPPAEAFAARDGNAADHAHILIAIARDLGHPARCVSGCVHGDGDALHQWAEVCVDGYGWIGFDSTRDLCPNDRYIRIAAGLDAHAAAAMSPLQASGGAIPLAVRITDQSRREPT